ncbi:MAG: alkyl sulfatase dimerization domain-containing protein [Pseudomonadales bacterium]|nr:alkyl sulfatase dimerization domain-containing protein [Pseudomonadales bacterium]
MAARLLASMVLVLLAACGPRGPGSGTGAETEGVLTAERKPPTAATRRALARVAASLPFEDDADFERATRGLIARDEALRIATEDGRTAWDMTRYGFIDGDAPDTVHPSLWRQAKLNDLHGLYEVTDGIYQVRGYDLSNVTFIRGETGWIVIDPLITAETARAALDLVNTHLGARPVSALLYTHSHVDHFGGARGVVDAAEVAAGRVPVFAPEGFVHHAVSENVLAGNAMSRRASYMYGRLLPPGPQGRVDAGLGRETSLGRVTLVNPTRTIGETGTRETIDGIEFVFQYTPGAEAPAEMMFYLPQFRALCVAEEANATLHNLYTPRGAQVRSGKLWAEWLDEAILLFGDDLDLVFGSHHWPRFGHEDALTYLEKQRDLYKYIHDQTLRLANQGETMVEIAEQLVLPDSLGLEWFNRDYYGTVNHNAKATYQLYLGWFDGNPAHLHPLPPEERALRYVTFMGGRDALLAKARAAYQDGDYRWVAEVVNHLVFADPDDEAARWLQADALEQLGYQAESGPWRNFYLTGAQELRDGISREATPQSGSPDIVAALTPEMLFDFLAVRLNGPEAADEDLTLNITFTDLGRDFTLLVRNGVLNYRVDRLAADADVALRLPRPAFMALLAGERQLPGLLADGVAELDGNPLALRTFGGLFDRFEFWFPIVTP